ncbi:MAG: hypothetical protein M0C28_07060 [Candidatus Moduliflexus flocculans]|nr:hypothetical protein [Candidatus Moduliflexus flocculans]
MAPAPGPVGPGQGRAPLRPGRRHAADLQRLERRQRRRQELPRQGPGPQRRLARRDPARGRGPSARDTVRADLTTSRHRDQRPPARPRPQPEARRDRGRAPRGRLQPDRPGRVHPQSPGRRRAAIPSTSPSPRSCATISRRFPVDPVARGDSWTEERRLTIPFQGLEVRVDLAITYTLDDLLPVRRRTDGPTSRPSTGSSVSGGKDLGEAQGRLRGRGRRRRQRSSSGSTRAGSPSTGSTSSPTRPSS